MKNNKQKSDFDLLIDAVYSASRMKPDTIPKGWYRAEEVASKKNISIWTAKRICTLAVREGKAECKFFRVQDRTKHVQRVKHYKAL